jgi:tetratricopeptide (TPR) repeat protein
MAPDSTSDSPPAGSRSEARDGAATARSQHPATRVPILAVLFIGLFGVLLASFPARNLDLWKHLADARTLARGTVELSPSWLYDLATYLVFSVGGGTALVAAKALVCGLIAVLVFAISCSRGGWQTPLAVTTLAALAMGSRLLLQPATVSVLFLALAVWLLIREETPSPVTGAVWPGWRLVALFVIWANVDAWFVLGLAVVALVWLGQLLDAPPAEGFRHGLRRWVGAVAILVAATCLSPSHVNGLRLPPELRSAAGVLREGETSAAFAVNSPFQAAFLSKFRDSVAVSCYYPLLALSLVSFLLNRNGWRWAWFLPWLGLAVVTGLQVRTVPFFAVVAGPVLAWNVQEVFTRRGTLPTVRPDVRYTAWSLACVAAVGLLACAWVGWLQGPPFGPRQWTVERPVALEQGSDFLRHAHAKSLWAAGTRTLHVSPDTESAFAWFCPEDRGLRDEPAVAGLLKTDDPEDRGRARLRTLGVNRVVVYAGDPSVQSLEVLQRLLSGPDEWPVLHLKGGLVVFGWRDPARHGGADPYQGWEVDFARLGFRPDESEVAPPGRRDSPGERQWWEAFWKPAPPRPAGRHEAAVLLMKAETELRSAQGRHVAGWEAGQAGGLVAAAGSWFGVNGPVDAALRLTLLNPPPPVTGRDGAPVTPPVTRVAFEFFRGFMFDRGDAPAGVVYAAVRAARRAVAENPTDANSYLVLGQAYRQLLNTSERAWAVRLPQLVKFRQVQASAALNRAAALNPRLAQAHLELALLYPQLNCLDLAAVHLRKYRDLMAEWGAPPEARKQAEAVEGQLARLTEVVEHYTREFAEYEQRMSVIDRAAMAERRGLGGKARDVLLKSDVAAFGAGGMELELDLLLRTGRPDDVLEWTTAEVREPLGGLAYHRLRALAFAAVGEYDAADTELALVVSPRGRLLESSRVNREVGGLVGKAVLDAQPGGSYLPHVAMRTLTRSDFQARVTNVARTLAEQADSMVVRGLVALEAGHIDRAREAFRAALAFSPDRWGGAQLEFAGRSVAWDCLTLIDGAAELGRAGPKRP